MMIDGLQYNIAKLIPVELCCPDETHSPCILALMPDNVPVVLYWLDGAWRDIVHQERTFVRWMYLVGDIS